MAEDATDREARAAEGSAELITGSLYDEVEEALRASQERVEAIAERENWIQLPSLPSHRRQKTQDLVDQMRNDLKTLGELLRESGEQAVAQVKLARDANDHLSRLLSAMQSGNAEQSRATGQMTRLTRVLVFLTGVLIILTALLVLKELGWVKAA